MSLTVRYTRHAEAVMVEREIPNTWVEYTALDPEWREQDPGSLEVERRFRAIPERGGRILRVICVETAEEIRILSAFFDRRATRP